MKTEDIKISTALYILLIIIVTVIAFGTWFSLTGLKKTNHSVETIYYDRLIPLQKLKAISDLLALDIVNTAYEMNHNEFDWNKGSSMIHKSLDEIRKNWNDYQMTEIGGKERAIKLEAERLYDGAIKSVEKLINISAVKTPETHEAFRNHISEVLYPTIDPFIAQLKKLTDVQIEIAHDEYDFAQSTFRSTFKNLLILSFVGLVLVVLFSLFIITTLNKSLLYTTGLIEKIAEGHLEIEVERQSKDEIGRLLTNINKMKIKLKEVIEHIVAGSQSLARASDELKAAAQQIAQGASEQASAIEEISASVEEMTSNIQQNLMNAQSAEQISTKAAGEITRLENAAYGSVKKIKEIADKISVIGAISFQTHILALNAAIEAARAGNHGRGFGVVAAEVGKLAERSKLAADEIDDLARISVSVSEESGNLLKAIAPDIISTSHFVQEITAANNEQSIGADQINEGVQQLNQVTQQNAASSQQLASHAEELAQQADDLRKAVDYFYLSQKQSHLPMRRN